MHNNFAKDRDQMHDQIHSLLFYKGYTFIFIYLENDKETSNTCT